VSDQPKIDPAKSKVEQQWKCDSPLMNCRFEPQGRYVFATAEDHTILRWDLATGNRIAYPGQGSWVKAMAFTPDGATLLASDYSGGLTWWPVEGDAP
jgi:WD40 repeat protein